jgi:hypothetical protein
MNDETCNGWTNRATWLVNLWLNNDEGLYTEALDTLKRAREPRKAIEEMTREILPAEGLAGDLIGFALSGVNWEEIAQGMAEDLEE